MRLGLLEVKLLLLQILSRFRFDACSQTQVRDVALGWEPPQFLEGSQALHGIRNPAHPLTSWA